MCSTGLDLFVPSSVFFLLSPCTYCILSVLWWCIRVHGPQSPARELRLLVFVGVCSASGGTGTFVVGRSTDR